MMDIHSHILPGIDDGAKDTAVSVGLLEMMKAQGITHVIATPHFDAMTQSIEEFFINRKRAYNELMQASAGLELPEVGVGCEVFYFRGMGRSEGIRELSLCGSDYFLFELPNCSITDEILDDIVNLREELELIPVIAHIERFAKEKHFKKLLELVKDGTIYAQVNASSLFQPYYRKSVLKFVKKGYASFIGTDAHSVDKRPPEIKKGLDEISKVLGPEYKNGLIRNSLKLCEEIFRKPGE